MKAMQQGQNYVLALNMGEELVSTILAYCKESGIQAAELKAIGALRDFELGYYWLSRKEYSRKKFSSIAELISCQGNIATREENLFAHLHAALGMEDFTVVGGHLFSGIVAVTVEVILHPLPQRMTRRYEETTGLYLLDLPLHKTF